jgi:hypothetical protein
MHMFAAIPSHMVPDHPQSELDARAVPTQQALSASFSSIRSVVRSGGQFTAGPRLHTKSKRTKDAGRSYSDMRKTSIGTDASIEVLLLMYLPIEDTRFCVTASPSLLGSKEQPISGGFSDVPRYHRRLGSIRRCLHKVLSYSCSSFASWRYAPSVQDVARQSDNGQSLRQHCLFLSEHLPKIAHKVRPGGADGAAEAEAMGSRDGDDARVKPRSRVKQHSGRSLVPTPPHVPA